MSAEDYEEAISFYLLFALLFISSFLIGMGLVLVALALLL